jgi:hypothetical protein
VLQDGAEELAIPVTMPCFIRHLRYKLCTKMDHICNIRESRGAMETHDPAAADPTA